MFPDSHADVEGEQIPQAEDQAPQWEPVTLNLMKIIFH